MDDFTQRIVVKCIKRARKYENIFFFPFFMEICCFFKEKPLSLHTE